MTSSLARWSTCRPRVVVTGLGVVSCLGTGIQHFWPRLLEGQTGITSIKDERFSWLPCRVGGVVRVGSGPGELNKSQLNSAKVRQRGLAAVYGVLAAGEALKDAQWFPDDVGKRMTGVAMGRVSADMESIGETNLVIDKNKSLRRVNPYTAARAMVNIAAFSIGEEFGFTGPQMAPSTACAASAHAIISACQAILLGDANVMICGGTDAVIDPLCYASYAKAKALSTNFNDNAENASKPFDVDRDGFVPAEGAAVLLLEELNHALNRGARIHAEVLGYGMCRDDGTLTAPNADGSGVADCMERAVDNAGLRASDVGYVNAHATSTPTGDEAEARALLAMFGKDSDVHVASNKGALGHMQGASGSVEALSCILSCREGVIPPTVNLRRPQISGLRYVMDKHVDWRAERRIGLSNSLGFGSTCGTLIFSNYIP